MAPAAGSRLLLEKPVAAASGAQSRAAQLRAKLRGQAPAEDEPKKVTVMPTVNERGEAVVVPKTREHLLALAGEEKGLLRQDSMRELNDLLLQGDEYGEGDSGEGMEHFGTGDSRTVRGQKKHDAKQEERELRAAQLAAQREIAASRKAEDEMRKCHYCPDASLDRSLVIAAAEHSFLKARHRRGLHVLECQIVPIAHIASLVEAETALRRELDMWKGCLIAMYRACRSQSAPAGLECIFVETVLDLRGGRRHTVLDVYVLPPSAMGDLGMAFRKQLSEEGDLWAQNPNFVLAFLFNI